MTPEELPTNPMQPYIDHIRSLGIEGRLVLWCHTFPANGLDWTAFIGDTNKKQISAGSFDVLVERIQRFQAEEQIDPIALGM